MDAVDCFREWGADAGDIGPFAVTAGIFFVFRLLDDLCVFADLIDDALDDDAFDFVTDLLFACLLPSVA